MRGFGLDDYISRLIPVFLETELITAGRNVPCKTAVSVCINCNVRDRSGCFPGRFRKDQYMLQGKAMMISDLTADGAFALIGKEGRGEGEEKKKKEKESVTS